MLNLRSKKVSLLDPTGIHQRTLIAYDKTRYTFRFPLLTLQLEGIYVICAQEGLETS